jgi:hypothetical protein
MISAVRIKFPNGSRPAANLKRKKLNRMWCEAERHGEQVYEICQRWN